MQIHDIEELPCYKQPNLVKMSANDNDDPL
jgi:hypothetical protein